MTDKPMDAERAVEILKACGKWSLQDDAHAYTDDEIASALAFLDGKHIYASRFKVGDEVWTLSHGVPEKCEITSVSSNGILGLVFVVWDVVHHRERRESDCFKTEAECERRNHDLKTHR